MGFLTKQEIHVLIWIAIRRGRRGVGRLEQKEITYDEDNQTTVYTYFRY